MKLQKETVRHGKWYYDACGTAFALELLGERWSLLIVRELMFGGRRFTDLRAGLPGISAKVLTERLDGLEGAGVVQRRHLPPPASTQIYELTPWGYQAEEAIKELGRWAAASPGHDPTLPLSAASLMLSFRTMFDAVRAEGLELTGSIRIGREDFSFEVREGELSVNRGTSQEPDFRMIAPTAMVVAALVYDKAPPEALGDRGLCIEGSLAAAASFADLFHLPEKADVPDGMRQSRS